MLITNTFASSKAVLGAASSKEDLVAQRPSSLEESTSTSVRGQHGRLASTSSSGIAGTSNTIPFPLTPSQTTTLSLFLRSSRSIAHLQIADIQGVIDPVTGEQAPPAVRKGRIRTATSSNNNNAALQCCIIESMPFEKCEIVATIVKKNAIYRQARGGYGHNPGNPTAAHHRDKSRMDLVDADAIGEEQVQLIFYELDDDSGASITCCVNPSKVYAQQISESRRRQASSSRTSWMDNDNDSTTASSYASSQEEQCQSTPRAARIRTNSASQEEDDSTPRGRTEASPKSDPRLWIYRYKSPPRPLPPRAVSNATTPSFNIPVYKEGTVVRIIGKIFINTSRGNERQLEASSIECAYEPGYISGKRIYTEKGNKYAEWHHTVKCRKKRLEYGDKDRVRELIGFSDNTGTAIKASNTHSISEDVTMLEDSTLLSFNDTFSTTASTSHISSTSLLDASRLPNTSSKSVNNTSILSTSSSTTGKTKKAKLPSCSTLYKQKIPITKEIFSLYMHQFFRDLEKGKHGKRGRILSGLSSDGFEGVEDDSMRVTLNDLKEDKNLKWLAEIYARNEAKRLALNTQDTSDCSSTPKQKSRYIATSTSAESSVLISSSSPAHSIRSTPHHRSTALMADTTNLPSTSSSTSIHGKVKVKVAPGIVDKLRNDLFRNTILKLVKDGIIIVFPADLSISTRKAIQRKPQVKECVKCTENMKIELDRLPPIMTMEGIPIRDAKAAQMQEEDCLCPQPSTSMKLKNVEETYGLLTSGMLLPVVENILKRLDGNDRVELEHIWKTVKRHDDLWRFVSKDLVKECLEMI